MLKKRMYTCIRFEFHLTPGYFEEKKNYVDAFVKLSMALRFLSAHDLVKISSLHTHTQPNAISYSFSIKLVN